MAIHTELPIYKSGVHPDDIGRLRSIRDNASSTLLLVDILLEHAGRPVAAQPKQAVVAPAPRQREELPAPAEPSEWLRILRGLATNAGALRAFEPEVRAVIGNTNWQCIADYVAQADAALEAHLAPRPAQPCGAQNAVHAPQPDLSLTDDPQAAQPLIAEPAIKGSEPSVNYAGEREAFKAWLKDYIGPLHTRSEARDWGTVWLAALEWQRFQTPPQQAQGEAQPTYAEEQEPWVVVDDHGMRRTFREYDDAYRWMLEAGANRDLRIEGPAPAEASQPSPPTEPPTSDPSRAE